MRPSIPLGLPFAPAQVEAHYVSWPLLPDLLPSSFPGVQSKRDEVVVDIDREVLVKRMKRYFDPETSNEEMRRLCPRALESTQAFDAPAARAALIKRGFKPEYVVRYCYRPFDLRWIYWEPEQGLLGRRSPDYFAIAAPDNPCIEARQRQPMDVFDRGYVTATLADNFGNGFSNFFPLRIQASENLITEAGPHPNVSREADGYLANIGGKFYHLFYHVAAILHSPVYRSENQGALKQDWPRIPLPATKDALVASATLGREVAALLDPEGPLPKSGKCVKTIATITAAEGRLDPDAGDLEITVGWGHAGKGGVTMPAKGRITTREMTPGEQEALPEGAIGILGVETCDVWLNGRAYWRNIPLPVWEYTLGGYQVIKKWLSYREKELLGRSLTVEEARSVTDIARRIAAILLMGPALDANYCAVKQATCELSKGAGLNH